MADETEQREKKRMSFFPDPKTRSTGVAAIVGVLSVFVTVILRVLEALLSSQISIVSVSEIPEIRWFIYSEYSAVGSDLVVVAFSLLVGAWVGTRGVHKKAAALAFPALMMFCVAMFAFLV